MDIGFVICLPTVWHMKIFLFTYLDFLKYKDSNKKTKAKTKPTEKTPTNKSPETPTANCFSQLQVIQQIFSICGTKQWLWGKKSILHWVYFCIEKNHPHSLVLRWLLVTTSLLLQNKQTLFKVESWIIPTSQLETLQHPLAHLQVFGSGRFWKSTAQKSSLTTRGWGSIPEGSAVSLHGHDRMHHSFVALCHYFPFFHLHILYLLGITHIN